MEIKILYCSVLWKANEIQLWGYLNGKGGTGDRVTEKRLKERKNSKNEDSKRKGKKTTYVQYCQQLYYNQRQRKKVKCQVCVCRDVAVSKYL